MRGAAALLDGERGHVGQGDLGVEQQQVAAAAASLDRCVCVCACRCLCEPIHAAGGIGAFGSSGW
eukprot:1172267-Prymnesium_polylepis.1